MDKIKPVAWALRTDDGRLDFNGCELEPTQADRDADEARGYEYVNLYDQSAIDALRAEVERLRGLLKSAPVVRIGGADGLSCFIEKFGKNSLPSMQGQSVSLVSVDAMKVGTP